MVCELITIDFVPLEKDRVVSSVQQMWKGNKLQQKDPDSQMLLWIMQQRYACCQSLYYALGKIGYPVRASHIERFKWKITKIYGIPRSDTVCQDNYVTEIAH